MLPRLILPAVAALSFAVAPPAGAASYKVVKATHTSSSAKTEGDYSGRSTTSWTLAKPGRIAIVRSGSTYTGLATLELRGTYSIEAATSMGSCAWSAPTGSDLYAAVAPEELSLMVGPDPRTGRGVIASFGAADASLSNPYLGTECTTGIIGEPKPEETSAVALRPAALKKKTLTLRYKGATARDGIDYRWSTAIVLRRLG